MLKFRVTLAAFLLASSSSAAQEKTSKSRMEACLGSAPTTADMLNCSGKELDRLDRELATVHKRLVSKVPSGEQPAFAKAQAVWRSYQTTTCALWVKLTEGGSMYPVLASGCAREVTEQRIKVLRAMLSAIEG